MWVWVCITFFCVCACVAISLHKIKKPASEIKSVIELLDVERLKQEEVDILMKIAPTEEEVCAHAWRDAM